jgi:hypothetical protein
VNSLSLNVGIVIVNVLDVNTLHVIGPIMETERYRVDFKVGTYGIRFKVVDTINKTVIGETEEVIAEGTIMEVQKTLENIAFELNQTWIEKQHYLEEIKDYTNAN